MGIRLFSLIKNDFVLEEISHPHVQLIFQQFLNLLFYTFYLNKYIFSLNSIYLLK